MQPNKRLSQSILYSVLAISILWCLKSAEILFGWNLSFMGLVPLEPSGMLGIITAPLVHGSLEHIFNNTFAILILASVLYYGYPKSWWKVTILVWILSGVGVWLFARQANHIGASGLTHGLFFFLFVASIFRRDKSSVAIMMIAFLLYGGMTMTIFPREEGISFEYHFFGALAGVIAALIWRDSDPKPVLKRYEWEDDGSDDGFQDDLDIGEQWQSDVPEESAEQPDYIKKYCAVKYIRKHSSSK